MKHTVLMAAVAALVLATAAQTAAAQEDEEGSFDEQMERREVEMELQNRQREFEHEQSMRELDLEERQLEIEQRRAEIDRAHQGPPGKDPHHKDHGILILLVIITHIVLTVWVFKDMNEKKIGRALWVPIVLLAGVFGAILYAIVRIADTRKSS